MRSGKGRGGGGGGKDGRGGGVVFIVSCLAVLRRAIDPGIPTYNARTKHVGFSSTRKILLTPSAKNLEVFGGSREG